MTTTDVVLPIGLWRDNRRIKEVTLREMTGADQEFFMDAGKAMPAAIFTSKLLARCMLRIGSVKPVTPLLVAELTVGDREALLLHLRRITFGEQMDPTISCPACEKNMDILLNVSELLVRSTSELPFHFERKLPSGEMVRFRLPCGADQEAVVDTARDNPAGAAKILLHRCMEKTLDELPSEILSEISGWMADLDPQAEIKLSLNCPECGHAFISLLDAASYLFEESIMRSRELYREIHLLAIHYHWSEAEILGLVPSKRQRYLKMLLETLE